jgi:hypothetical protein
MRHQAESGSPSQLRLTSPAMLRGMALPIRPGWSVLGRAADSGLRVDHPDVSRTHAAIEQQADQAIVEDLGSTNGTTVNGIVVDRPRPLHHGDVLRFGSVAAVFEDLRTPDAPTSPHGWTAARATPTSRGDAEREPAVAARARFDVDEQYGAWISNVGGDQYVMAERQSFLREIAAARTRARRIILVGFLLFLAGLVGQIWVIYDYSAGFEQMWGEVQNDPAPGESPLPDMAFRVAAVSSGVFALGVVVMLTGLVLHIMAAARRRRVEDDQRLLRSAGYPAPGSAPLPHTGGPGGIQHRQATSRRHQQRSW